MKKQKKPHRVQPSWRKPSACVPLSPETGRSLVFMAVVIACLTFLVYLPGLGNGFVDWDDTQYIVQNTKIKSLRWELFRWALFDYRTNLWHPLTWLSHAVDYAVWDLNPFGHHLTNNILHAINTGVVFWLSSIFIRLASISNLEFKAVDTRFLFVASGTTALLFGLHPIHVESVAWVAERKDLLYSLFYMASTIAYLYYAQSMTSGGKQTWFRHRLYWLALGLFFLSLASKPMAVTLPAVLLILDWYPLRRTEQRRSLWPLLLEKIPFVALSAGVSLLTILAQKSVGGLKSLENATIGIRIAVAFKSLTEYLWNLAIPVKLLPFYPYPKDASLVKPAYIAAVLLVILITAYCIKVAKQQKIFLAAWCYFVVTVFPVLGFFQAGWQAMADRFMYLPSLGPLLVTGIGCAYIWGKIDSTGNNRIVLRACFAVVMLATSFVMIQITLKQTAIWKNSVTLWEYNVKRTAKIYPEALFLRGSAYRDEKQYDKAIEDFSKAITLDTTYALAYIERAGVFLEKKQYALSIEDARRGISLDPKLEYGHVIRGTAYFMTGDTSRAIDEYNAAIAKKPDSTPAFIGRGFASKSRGETVNAIQDYTKALSIDPGLADIYLARGDLYLSSGLKELATKDFQKACRLGNQPACVKAVIPF